MLQRSNSIICLAAGNTQIPLIKAAKSMGYSVVVIDRNLKAKGVSYADIFIPVSTYDTAKVLMELRKLKKMNEFRGIVARASGPALFTASEIAREFRLPGLSRDIAFLATQKANIREFCTKRNIPVPKGYRIKRQDEIDSTFRLPFLVKPDYPLVGKKDIRIVLDKTQVGSAVREASKSSYNEFVEIEEYIEGFDVSTLFLLKGGNATILTSWDELAGIDCNNLVKGIGVSIPSVIAGKDVEKKIAEIISRFAKHFSSINALLILSFRIDMLGNPYVIELHADLSGDLIADILLPESGSYGDFFEIAIKVSTDQHIGVTRFGLIPTCLVYNIWNCPQNLLTEIEIIQNQHIVKKGSIIDNLSFIDTFFKELDTSIRILPQHKKWMCKR